MVKFDKETALGVIFEGKMKMYSVSKYTTCDDVTEMVMYSCALSYKSGDYALFETAHDIERMLARKSSVLKVIRSWGSAKGDVSLLVRKADLITGKKIKLNQLKAMKKLEKIKSLIMANKAESKTTNITMNYNLDNGVNSKKQLMDKSVFGVKTSDRAIEQSGKFSLMKRYLNDVANTATNNMVHETVTSNHPQKCVADATYTIDSSTERPVIDFERSTSVSDLDAAFVCDNSVNKTVELLNECICSDLDTSDAESAFYELSSGESDCEENIEENVLEQNVYEKQTPIEEDDDLKELFIQIGNSQSSYDTVMGSFMDTLVNQSPDDDEGLSSIGSDQ